MLWLSFLVGCIFGVPEARCTCLQGVERGMRITEGDTAQYELQHTRWCCVLSVCFLHHGQHRSPMQHFEAPSYAELPSCNSGSSSAEMPVFKL